MVYSLGLRVRSHFGSRSPRAREDSARDSSLPQVLLTCSTPQSRHPRSPTWHRRLRKKRSAARLRLRICALSGIAPSRRDLKRVQEHHAAPPNSMGKWGNAQGDKGKGWQYWPGSWSASPGRQAPWKAPKPPTATAFAAYDAKKADVDKNQTAGSGPSGQDAEATLVQELQKAVNSARRTENKVKKLLQDKAERQQQWQSWEQDLKKAYARERGRYQAALAKLDSEMVEALRAQDLARAAVRRVACGSQIQDEHSNSMEWDSEFEELVGADPWEELTRDAVLQRALSAAVVAKAAGPSSAASGTLATPTRLTSSAPRTPTLLDRSHTSRLVQPPPRPQVPGSRLVPFPAPVQSQQMAYGPVCDGGIRGGVKQSEHPGAVGQQSFACQSEDPDTKAGGQGGCQACWPRPCERRFPVLPGQDGREKSCIDPAGLPRGRRRHGPGVQPEQAGWWRGGHGLMLSGSARMPCWHAGTLGELLGARAPGHGVVLGPPRRAVHSDDAVFQLGKLEGSAANVQPVCVAVVSTVHYTDHVSFLVLRGHVCRDSGAFFWVLGLRGACALPSTAVNPVPTAFPAECLPCLQIRIPVSEGACIPRLPCNALSSSAIASSSACYVSTFVRPFWDGSALGLDMRMCENCATVGQATHSVAAPAHLGMSHEQVQHCGRESIVQLQPYATQGIVDARRPADWQFDDVAEWISIFCRSCLLLYLLSCCHLLFRTAKLQPRSVRVNCFIRCGRGCFKGAPTLLAVGILAHLIPVCAGMHHVGRLHTDSRDVAEAALPSPFGGRQASGDDGSRPRGPSLAAFPEDPKYLVEVFQFQHSPCYHAVWMDPGDTVGYLRCTVQDELFCAGQDRIVAVCPQPDRDCAVFLDAPDWILNTMSIPVLVEIRTPTIRRYMEVFTGKVDAEIIRLSLGDAWPAGGRVFIGDSVDSLRHGQIAQLKPGDLVRVIPRGMPVPRCFPLATKLTVPRRWFSCEDKLEEYSLEHDSQKFIGLVGVMGDWSTIPADNVHSVPDLKSAIVESCGCDERTFQVQVPSTQPFDLFFRSYKVVSLIAVAPRALAGCCTLFLDARELAIPVTALFLPPLRTPLEQVLRLAGGSRPTGLSIVVEGIPDFDEVTETLMPVHQGLCRITVSRLSPWGEEPDRDDLPTRASRTSLGKLDVRGEGIQGASSKVCEELDEGPPPGSHGGYGTAAGDESAGDDEVHVPLGSLDGTQVDGPVAPNHGEVEAWQLPVRVLSFQGAEEFRVLWTFKDEGIQSFLERAKLELLRSELPCNLHIPDPQPGGGFITVCLSPVWWSLVGLYPVLVAEQDKRAKDALAVWSPGDAITGLLPCASESAAARVDVYTSGDSLFEGGSLKPGSLVFFQRAGLPRPALAAASSVLGDVQLACQEDQLPGAPIIPRMRYLLLGSQFTQQVVDLEYGSVTEQVARATGLPAVNLKVWFQKGASGAFGTMNVQGMHVEKCLGYRLCSKDDVVGNLLFIDARACGKPVCCRLVETCIFRVEDFLDLLGISIPMHYTARFSGGDPVGGDPMVLKFLPSTSVTIWVECALPSSALSPGSLALSEDDDNCEGHDDVSGSSGGSERPARAERKRPHSPSVPRGNEGSAPKGAIDSAGVHKFDGVDCRRVLPTPCRAGIGARSLTGAGSVVVGFNRLGAAWAAATEEVGPLFDSDVRICAGNRLWKWGPNHHASLPCDPADTSGSQGNHSVHLPAQEAGEVGGVDAPRLLAFEDAVDLGKDRPCLQARALGPSAMDEDAGRADGLADADRVCVPACQTPCILALEHLLPTVTHSGSGSAEGGHSRKAGFAFGDLAFGFSRQDVLDLVTAPACLATWDDFLRICDPKTATWFDSKVCQAEADCGHSLLCYTDGSFTPATADTPALLGWAVAFFQSCDDMDTVECLGVASGPFPAFLRDELHLPTAFLAECCALAYAALLSMVLFPGRGVTYVADCTAALSTAVGGAHIERLKVQQVLRGLHFLRKGSSDGSIQYRHTRSHEGEVPNEVVDVASKKASRGRCLGKVVFSRPELWCSEGGQALIWAATACRALRGDVELPPVLGSGLGDDRDHWQMAAYDIIAPFVASPLSDERLPFAKVGLLRVCFASVNVLSLIGVAGKDKHSQPSGLAMQVAKPAILAQTLDKAGVDAVALQESRCEQGVLRTGNFLRFCSGHEGKQFGCELWFREGHSFLASGKIKLCFRKDAFSVRYADPRRLFVLLKHGRTQCMFVSVHAPHRAVELHQLRDWWVETRRLCRELIRCDMIVFGGDCNACLGNVVSASVQDFGSESQDVPGEQLHMLLQDLGLWVPSTFEGVHSGQTWTYMHKRGGATTRPDFVAIPLSWQGGCITSRVEPEVHAGQACLDHLAVLCSCSVQVAGFEGQGRLMRPRIDEAAVADPINRDKVEQIVLSAPVVPWNVSAHAHAAVLACHLQKHLGEEFPMRPCKRAHQFLTEASVRLRAKLAQARRACSRLRNQVQPDTTDHLQGLAG